MIRYRLLLPELLEATYEKVEKHLPDSLRSLPAFAALYGSRTSVFYEVGDFQGVFWLTELVLGWKANMHIVLWDSEVKKQHTRAKGILHELINMFQLRRTQVFIPISFTAAIGFAEGLGFMLEGVLRKFDYYGEQLVDVGVYGLLKEDV